MKIIQLIFFFIIFVCLQSNAQTENAIIKYKITGRVVDAKTGEPIDSVKVTCMISDTIIDYNLVKKMRSDSSNKNIYYTNKNGTYTGFIENKRLNNNSNCLILFERKGYISWSKKILITSIHEKDILENCVLQRIEKDVCGLTYSVKIRPIYFDSRNSKIRSDSAFKLDKLSEAMKEIPTMIIELDAHTDCKENSMKLSDQRVKAVIKYIVNHGIDKSRVYGKGYGAQKLFNGCDCKSKSPCTEDEHQLNRRVEFKIVKNDITNFF